MIFNHVLSVYVLLFVSSIYALTVDFNGRVKKSLKAIESPCAAQLSQIVFYPNNAAFKYLAAIESEFFVIAEQALNDYEIDPTNGGLLGDFLQKYGISAVISQPFGGSIKVAVVNGQLATTGYGLTFWHGYAQSVVLGVAFDFDSYSQEYSVTFQLVSDDASFTTITFLMPAASFTPDICQS